MRIKRNLVIAGFLLVHFIAFAQNQRWHLQSPDKKIEVNISNEKGTLSYWVNYDGKKAILKSPLGIEMEDQDFASGLNFKKKRTSSFNEDFTLLVGKRVHNQQKGNELVLSFTNANNKNIDLTFRAFNDGMAFRYFFPDQNQKAHRISKERSGFSIAKEGKAWIQPYDLNVRKKPCYETYYENGVPVGSESPNPAGWAFPALFNVNNLWLLISEAGLNETYCATHLEDKNKNGLYTIRFPEKEEVTSDVDPEPISTLPWTTPWRLTIIGTSLSTIENSMLVSALNPPSVIDDTSWIKPGRASWSWWSNGASPKDYNILKDYVDFTAEMGWEYTLLDAGWPQMEGGNVEDLIKYANSKGVGIFLWYHCGMGREKDTLSMANLFAFPEARKKELQKIKSWDAKGIKVDFFDGDKQPVIKRYMDILKDAADVKIMVNFHGSTLPRGWERTYPHLVSMESVKGAEGYGRQDFCDRAPVHNTILPFTRNIVGSMDYTPVTFTNKREATRQTTFGHELALSVVFESGVFHFADRLSAYQALPTEPKEFLKNIPTVWDETQYIAGIPGQYVVLTRRKGNTWYVGGINGLNEAKEIFFDLPFIKNEKEITIITDGEEPGSFLTSKRKINGKNITVMLKPRGGFVATF
jgi:hypothetical protein